ncbi:hypothetical protein [Streptomyces sp. 8L]|uniref:hypothetical protein n=1 Tax=Streptomyces sp. 8L TaxID=2877242 RepID=UPI001CD2566D|nr:hypothetical protein [Streptomyces sp. 8L]MCA1223598.1 hypothetical protein [Streptomyces sp. 8L]
MPGRGHDEDALPCGRPGEDAAPDEAAPEVEEPSEAASGIAELGEAAPEVGEPSEAASGIEEPDEATPGIEEPDEGASGEIAPGVEEPRHGEGPAGDGHSERTRDGLGHGLSAGTDRLPVLLESVLGIGTDLELGVTLQYIVEAAVELVGAVYGELGVVQPENAALTELFSAGADEAGATAEVPVRVADEVFGTLRVRGKRGDGPPAAPGGGVGPGAGRARGVFCKAAPAAGAPTARDTRPAPGAGGGPAAVAVTGCTAPPLAAPDGVAWSAPTGARVARWVARGVTSVRASVRVCALVPVSARVRAPVPALALALVRCDGVAGRCVAGGVARRGAGDSGRDVAVPISPVGRGLPSGATRRKPSTSWPRGRFGRSFAQ